MLNFSTLAIMRGFPDFLPPGPKVPDYDFTIVYFVPPIGGKYRDEIVARLRSGIPQTLAGSGLPVTRDAVMKIAQREGITRKHAKYELRRIGDGTMDAWDVYECYEKKNMSGKQIAKLAKCDKKKIYKILDIMGVRDRMNRKGSRVGTVKRMKLLNTPTRRGNSNPRRDKAISRWKKLYGKKYLPVYEDIQRGMSAIQACKKHGVNFFTMRNNIARMRDKHFVFLDWGQKQKFSLYATKHRLEQWAFVAQSSGNNVLDWATSVLNREADKNDNVNARIKSRKHRRPALPESSGEGEEDTGGESGAIRPSV